MIKKLNRRKLIKELITLAKQIAKKRDKNICQRCNKVCSGSDCHGSHIYPVSMGHALAWEVVNILTFCFHCHMNWWHKNPIEAGRWVEKRFPDRILYLESLGTAPKKFTDEELLQAKIDLQEILAHPIKWVKYEIK